MCIRDRHERTADRRSVLWQPECFHGTCGLFNLDGIHMGGSYAPMEHRIWDSKPHLKRLLIDNNQTRHLCRVTSFLRGLEPLDITDIAGDPAVPGQRVYHQPVSYTHLTLPTI